MRTQQREPTAFQALHAGEPFVIPNPWDAGSARVLEALGFKALATTSSGFAFTLGRLDGTVTLDEIVQHVSALAGVTDLPISVDLENGYGAEPESAALAVTRVAEAGRGRRLDRGLRPRRPPLRAPARRRARQRRGRGGAGARRPFTLTARAENHLRGNPDLEDTITRLQAFEAAGADVLYAPGLRPRPRSAPLRRRPEAGERAGATQLSFAEIVEAGAQAGQRWRELDLDDGERSGSCGNRDPDHGDFSSLGDGSGVHEWLAEH